MLSIQAEKFFTSDPFSFEYKQQKVSISLAQKVAVIALTILASLVFVFSAPFVFFGLAKHYRMEAIQELKNQKIAELPLPGQEVKTLSASECGRLYTLNGVQILELKADHPYESGLAHGYLLGEKLSKILDGVKSLLEQPLPSQTFQMLLSQIPENYLAEMNGIVEGFNQWRHEKGHHGGPLSLNQLVKLHLVPDSMYLGIPTTGGCTTIVEQDSEQGMILGRNLDWNSYDVLGEHSICIHRISADSETFNISVPGFVGTTTAVNKDGLCLSMNVCPGNTKSLTGLPAAFFNRNLIDTCESVSDVAMKVLQGEMVPLGPYHLIASDDKDAAAFHLYQKPGEKEHLHLPKKPEGPIVVTNTNLATGKSAFNIQPEREALIKSIVGKNPGLPKLDLIEKILKTEPVNNGITIQSVIYTPKTGEMKFSHGNHFAASETMHQINLKSIFTGGKCLLNETLEI